jgi:hypothetical protein
VGAGGLMETILWMSRAELHIGPLSGPMHLANTIGLRTICIINFPEPWTMMLPVIKNIDTIESEWILPQSHILHQDHHSAHWPKFSLASLEAAYNRETYPYETPFGLSDFL